VLCILPYDTEEEAIRIANDTPYGLSAYVFGDTHEHAAQVGSRIRAGNVHLNGASLDVCGSFGGYKQSGLGREWVRSVRGVLEVKSSSAPTRGRRADWWRCRPEPLTAARPVTRLRRLAACP